MDIFEKTKEDIVAKIENILSDIEQLKIGQTYRISAQKLQELDCVLDEAIFEVTEMIDLFKREMHQKIDRGQVSGTDAVSLKFYHATLLKIVNQLSDIKKDISLGMPFDEYKEVYGEVSEALEKVG